MLGDRIILITFAVKVFTNEDSDWDNWMSPRSSFLSSMCKVNVKQLKIENKQEELFSNSISDSLIWKKEIEMKIVLFLIQTSNSCECV